MENFIKYMRRRNPVVFFFFGNMAVIGYSRYCAIVSISTGEVLHELKVKYLSKALYSEHNNTLYLHATQGQVYSFSPDSPELRRIGNNRYLADDIFLSHTDGQLVILGIWGEVAKLNADGSKLEVICKGITEDSVVCGWDNPINGCYEFVSQSHEHPPTIRSVSHDGELVGNKRFTHHGSMGDDDNYLHGLQMDWESKVLCTHWGTYENAPERALNLELASNALTAYCDTLDSKAGGMSVEELKNKICSIYEMFGNPLDGEVEWVSIISKYDSGSKQLVLKNVYEGGNEQHCFYGHNLILAVGGRRIYVIDTNELAIVREFTVDSPVFSMQYEPMSDTLFACTGVMSISVISNVLRR